MQRSGIDPPGGSLLLIAGPVRMPREQVIGFLRREATQLRFGVTVHNSNSAPRQSDYPTTLETGASHLVDRPTHALAIPITVPEDDVTGELAAFVNDLGSRQVATVDENLRPGRHETINRRSSSVHLVMGV
jgi:hypothetical protein